MSVTASYVAVEGVFQNIPDMSVTDAFGDMSPLKEVATKNIFSMPITEEVPF